MAAAIKRAFPKNKKNKAKTTRKNNSLHTYSFYILGFLLVALVLTVFSLQHKQTIQQRAQTAIWQPPPNTTWQWQLTGTIDTSVNAAVYDIDWETDASVVQTLHSQGKKVICYMSVGSFEDWRPDAGSFPAAVRGSAYEGWPGEWWLDIRSDTVKQIMAARFDTCKAKGFDAIEPDNMDVPDGNGSGFPLTEADELAYANWLADQAHSRGMSIGIKNTGSQVASLVQKFDFAVVEECYQYNECDTYTPFIQANKAVFEAEYALDTTAFCPQAKEMKISAIKKNLNLDAPREACALDAPISISTNPTTLVPTSSAQPTGTQGVTPTFACVGGINCVPTAAPTSPMITPQTTQPVLTLTLSPSQTLNQPTTGQPQPTQQQNQGSNNGNNFFEMLLNLIRLIVVFFLSLLGLRNN